MPFCAWKSPPDAAADDGTAATDDAEEAASFPSPASIPEGRALALGLFKPMLKPLENALRKAPGGKGVGVGEGVGTKETEMVRGKEMLGLGKAVGLFKTLENILTN